MDRNYIINKNSYGGRKYMWGEFISGCAIIIVAIIEALAHKDRTENKKIRENMKHHENLRRQEALLQLEMESANIKLTKIIAKKVQNQETNGDVEEAYKAVHDAQMKYYQFINGIAINEIQERD